jgi:anti-sigma regulatory factor (Ser/Thr protein kinase)
VSPAVENAFRFEREQATAEVLQRSLLPEELPALEGVELTARYLPGTSGVKIGGDWYDVFALPSGRLSFVVGDVVGRGVMAASVMSEIRIAVRAYLAEGHALEDVMRMLNDLLVSMGRNRSATAAVLELDFETGELQAVSAGHLPPLLLGPDGESRLLELPPGLPLGIRSGGGYKSRRYAFPEGSVLLLFTDGLVERRGESIDEGLARLREAAREAAADDDSSFADRVYRRLLEETTLDDDVALLTIESIPLGPRIEMTLDAHPRVLAGLRRTLGRWLISEGVGEDELFNITLAASEAAANSIEHAYGAHDATFRICCEHDGDRVQVVVSDDGRWRDSRPYGRGRGLAIMRALVDGARIERREDGTSVTLTKHLQTERA